MEKKLYWLVESNDDLSIIVNNIELAAILIENDFESLDDDEKKETQYTVTPEYLTEDEYEDLPEN